MTCTAQTCALTKCICYELVPYQPTDFAGSSVDSALEMSIHLMSEKHFPLTLRMHSTKIKSSENL
jgi:hypothetical protein